MSSRGDVRVRGEKGHGEREIKMLYCAAVFIVTRLYSLNKQRKRLLICYSRKVAKTSFY